MGEDLYLVTVKGDLPTFLSPGLQLTESDLLNHQRFIEVVQRRYSGFGFPYFAMFSDGSYQVPASPIDSEFGNFDHEPDFIDDVIRRHLECVAFADIPIGPATAVVQFTNSGGDLFPRSLARLCRKYTVRRVVLDSID
ncbi:hypothetical protein HN419_02500 [Candidatus Woesearchaeota archaeon]|jgi:hypothetical protein|nr:hypothetical protein [Candidatus Woesearchaeota archaeon]MBT3537133.1 hypothetical protein [Candidatus Woesearchaeota archaeon]MBT4697740.1 hypothetical protein [Candidatus Woesearchaeota archaeon]MBT4716555.1 hypothetical protein [Candidatus Woesearchaeota archaeon]MBT7106557.1 hypothetical protein [Candidatus Woesearchaeota archaeon]